jgi:hypothetical protein
MHLLFSRIFLAWTYIMLKCRNLWGRGGGKGGRRVRLTPHRQMGLHEMLQGQIYLPLHYWNVASCNIDLIMSRTRLKIQTVEIHLPIKEKAGQRWNAKTQTEATQLRIWKECFHANCVICGTILDQIPLLKSVVSAIRHPITNHHIPLLKPGVCWFTLQRNVARIFTTCS